MIVGEEKSMESARSEPFKSFDLNALNDKVFFFGWDHHFLEDAEHGVEFTKTEQGNEWRFFINRDKRKVRLESSKGSMITLDEIGGVMFNRETGQLDFFTPKGESYEISDRGHTHTLKNFGGVVRAQVKI